MLGSTHRHSPEVRGQGSELGSGTGVRGQGLEFTGFLGWLLSAAAIAKAELERGQWSRLGSGSGTDVMVGKASVLQR